MLAYFNRPKEIKTDSDKKRAHFLQLLVLTASIANLIDTPHLVLS